MYQTLQVTTKLCLPGAGAGAGAGLTLPCLPVGNKNDDPERKVVETEDAYKFAGQMGIQLFETSAKENVNVEEVRPAPEGLGARARSPPPPPTLPWPPGRVAHSIVVAATDRVSSVCTRLRARASPCRGHLSP